MCKCFVIINTFSLCEFFSNKLPLQTSIISPEPLHISNIHLQPIDFKFSGRSTNLYYVSLIINSPFIAMIQLSLLLWKSKVVDHLLIQCYTLIHSDKQYNLWVKLIFFLFLIFGVVPYCALLLDLEIPFIDSPIVVHHFTTHSNNYWNR